MALIKDWLPDFLIRHRSRLRPGDWPEPGTEDESDFQGAWFSAFMAIEPRVREGEADTASNRLASNPPNFAREHLPAVLAEIRALRDANRATDAAVPGSRDAAEAQSRNCVHCSGGGQVIVFHPRYAGSRVVAVEVERHGEVTKTVTRATAAAHCVCPLGRWMRANVDDEIRRGIPDLQDVFDGRSRWRDRDPTIPAENPDADPVGLADAIADFREQSRRWRAKSHVPTLFREGAREAEQAQRQAVLVRAIRAALEAGPRPWARIFESVAPEGYTDRELRRAAAAVPVIESHASGREVWDMERQAAPAMASAAAADDPPF